MLLNTKHFGEIDYDENTIITFEEGMPGFDDTQFLLLADNPNDLFCWLQSVEDGDLAFVLMDVKQVMPEYDPQIEPEMLESLTDDAAGGSGAARRSGATKGPGAKNSKASAFSYYNIAVVPDDLQKMRVNLKAPVVINTVARKGKQVIASNEDYSLRHYIFDEIDSHNRQVM